VLAKDIVWGGERHQLLVIDGNSFRNTGDFTLGTFSTSGNTVSFNSTQGCAPEGSEFMSSGQSSAFEYSVDGDSLILFEEGIRSRGDVTVRVGLVYTKHTGDLCHVSGTAECTIDDCYCAATLDGVLSDAQCGG